MYHNLFICSPADGLPCGGGVGETREGFQVTQCASGMGEGVGGEETLQHSLLG